MKTKRIILATVSVLVFFTVLFSLSAVAENNNVVFGLSDFNALSGQAFETTLFLEENSNLVDFQLQLKYDTELVTLQSAEQDDELPGTATMLHRRSVCRPTSDGTSIVATGKWPSRAIWIPNICSASAAVRESTNRVCPAIGAPTPTHTA